MKKLTVFLLMLVLLSCNKDDDINNDPCEDCLFTLYECDKAGGEATWTINGHNEVKSGGYFNANIPSGNEVQQFFEFAGNFNDCWADISGSTTSEIEKFGVGTFFIYICTVNLIDFCGEDIVISGDGSFKITSYDGKNASGTFKITQPTGGETQCKPDVWTIDGTFNNIPVY